MVAGNFQPSTEDDKQLINAKTLGKILSKLHGFITSNINTAVEEADTSIRGTLDDAMAEAKEYIDTEVASAKTYADGKETSAKAYTDTKAAEVSAAIITDYDKLSNLPISKVTEKVNSYFAGEMDNSESYDTWQQAAIGLNGYYHITSYLNSFMDNSRFTLMHVFSGGDSIPVSASGIESLTAYPVRTLLSAAGQAVASGNMTVTKQASYDDDSQYWYTLTGQLTGAVTARLAFQFVVDDWTGNIVAGTPVIAALQASDLTATTASTKYSNVQFVGQNKSAYLPPAYGYADNLVPSSSQLIAYGDDLVVDEGRFTDDQAHQLVTMGTLMSLLHRIVEIDSEGITIHLGGDEEESVDVRFVTNGARAMVMRTYQGSLSERDLTGQYNTNLTLGGGGLP